MRGAVEPDFRRNPWHRPSDAGLPSIDGNPVLAMTYRLAEAVMDVAGPLFWAVLVLGFIKGSLGIDVFR
jgi:hypothetical protein